MVVVPGINTTFSHYVGLLESAELILGFMKPDQKGKLDREYLKLVHPCVLTLYSAFECYLNEQEDELSKRKGISFNYSQKEQRIEHRPFAFYKKINDHSFDKSLALYDDFNHFVKLRNLIAHAEGETITWSNANWLTSTWVSLTGGSVSNKEMRKINSEAKASRDMKADKVISFLQRRGLISTNATHRYMSWMSCIENPNVAKWSYDVIIDMMDNVGSGRFMHTKKWK